MSTIAANLITDVAGTNSPEFSRGELCRARFNLNGTGTIAERDSFNVSSYVDNGVGDYTTNFTTAFPNVNYSPNVNMGHPNTATERNAIQMFAQNAADNYTESAPTTSAFRVSLSNTGGNGRDNVRVCCAITGDRV